MLGKLIKHEFKAVSKVLGILHIALLITTIMGIFAINISKHSGFIFFNELTFILYIFILIAISIAVMIYIVIRFYQNIFTDEGYLTNTLPVKPYEHIIAKLYVSFVWVIINAICTLISFFFLMLSQSSISEIKIALWNYKSDLLDLMGNHTQLVIFLMILGVFISVIYMLIMSYAAIAIGQTMRNHKVLFSLGAYVVLYVLSQIVSTIIRLPFGFISLLETNTINWNTFFVPIILLSYLLSTALIILYFFITNYIISKKLNLD
jgi:hypothetical protein